MRRWTLGVGLAVGVGVAGNAQGSIAFFSAVIDQTYSHGAQWWWQGSRVTVAFDETQCALLPNPVMLDDGSVLASGTRVNCSMIHHKIEYYPIGDTTTTFPEPILGTVSSYASLSTTDAACGLPSPATYPSTLTERGIEPAFGGVPGDSVVVSGFDVTVETQPIAGDFDNVRVLTECVQPITSDWVSLTGGPELQLVQAGGDVHGDVCSGTCDPVTVGSYAEPSLTLEYTPAGAGHVHYLVAWLSNDGSTLSGNITVAGVEQGHTWTRF